MSRSLSAIAFVCESDFLNKFVYIFFAQQKQTLDTFVCTHADVDGIREVGEHTAKITISMAQ